MGADLRVIESLRGRSVVFTGRLYLRGDHIPRDAAIGLARSLGARVRDNHRAKVSRITDVLVRGESELWSHGTYGDDETEVARLQGEGHRIQIIDASGFESLVDGGWAYAIAPHDALPPMPPETAPYRPVSADNPVTAVPTIVNLAAATNAHMKFQNDLAKQALAAGLSPLRSTRPDVMFDLGWLGGDGRLVIVEVKTLTGTNARQQLRLGLGQVLDYTSRLGDVTAVLAVDVLPPENEHWTALCQSHAVSLVWPDTIDTIL